MGANAQTSVPTFTAGEILTAANMNISARTGIPVFATSTTRDAAFGGTGEKTLAEGQFAYLEDSNTTQYYDGAAWQTVGITPGLVCVKAETAFTSVASFTADSVFSSTYTNYRILVNYTTGSTNGTEFQLRAGGVDTTVNYNGQELDVNNTTITGTRLLAFTGWYVALPTNGSYRANLVIDLFSPNVAIATSMQTYNYASAGAFNLPRIKITYGNQSDATQFDGFKILNVGNLTGNYAVYAYSKTV